MAIASSLHNGAPTEVSSCLAGHNLHSLCVMQICAWEGAGAEKLVEAVPDIRAGRLVGPAEGSDIYLPMPACHIRLVAHERRRLCNAGRLG